MADEQLIKPRELPAATAVFADDAIMTDDGVTVGKATPVQIVNAGAPVPTEAEAIAGTDNSKRMTPLTTKQVLDSVTAPSVMRAAAWAESGTQPDPSIPGSMSAKSWAAEAERLGSEQADRAEAAAADAVNNAPFVVKDYDTFAALPSLTVGARYRSPGMAWDVVPAGSTDYDFVHASGALIKVVPENGARDARAFGVVAGEADSWSKLQKAFDAAPKADVILPDGQLFVSQPLITDGNVWREAKNTVVSPAVGASLDYVIRVAAQNKSLPYLYVDCKRRATTGISVRGFNGSTLQSPRIEGYIIDGIRFEVGANNNNSLVVGGLIRSGGTTYSTGSITASSGATSVTITDADIDLRTLPEIGAGRGWLWIGTDVYEIVSATSADTLQIYPSLSTALTSSPYTIKIGASITVLPHGDNSEIRVERLNAQNSPCGLDDLGLYGVKGRNNLYQLVDIGRAVNRKHRSGSSLTLSPSDDDAYIEGTKVSFYLGSSSYFRAIGGNSDHTENVVSSTATYGTEIKRGRLLGTIPQVFSVNSTAARLAPVGGVIHQIGAPNKIVNLPAAPAAGALRNASGLTCKITVSSQSNGYTTIVTTDGSTIMGASGSTGVRIRGSRRVVTATYNPYTNDWYLDIPPVTGRYNATGGMAAGATYTLAVSGFDATTARLIVTVSGAATTDDAYLMQYKITDRTESGCNIVVRNGGSVGQLFTISWAAFEAT